MRLIKLLKNTLPIHALLCFSSTLLAQTADRQTVSAGGDFFVLTSNVNFQSTVGEVVTETLQTGTLIFTQGFEQAENVIDLTADAGVPVDVVVYPNPTADQVKIRFNLNAPAFIVFTLINNAGQVVHQSEQWLTAGLQDIPFNFKTAPGLYILSLGFQNQFHAYKVIVD